MFWLYLWYTSLTAFCGVALGLLISSLVADAKDGRSTSFR